MQTFQPGGSSDPADLSHPTIWIDVEDLFDYFEQKRRPSGIQRLGFLLQQALQSLGPASVKFVRHTPGHSSFAEVPWSSVEHIFTTLAHSPPRPEIKPDRNGPGAFTRVRRFYAPVLNRLPGDMLQPLRHAAFYQVKAARALGAFARAALLRNRRTPPVPADPETPGPEIHLMPGDWLLSLGSPWFAADYGKLLTQCVLDRGGQVAVLIYDLIPFRRPEWFDQDLVQAFSCWFASTIPLASVVFTISHATAADLRLVAGRGGLALTPRVVVIPVGSGLGTSTAPSATIPVQGPYVLFVSTIEARKNHALLFRVWRRLLEDLPPGAVPTLVFLGRVGWLVADFMQQLNNADFLDGKIVVLEDVADNELSALYAGCLFTVFPSLYEGWGLPVTESLAFGKPCLVANNSSLPEAGGTLARYFDAEDTNDAYRAIRAILDDRPGLAAWQAELRRTFRPVPWTAAAALILETLGVSVLTDRAPN